MEYPEPEVIRLVRSHYCIHYVFNSLHSLPTKCHSAENGLNMHLRCPVIQDSIVMGDFEACPNWYTHSNFSFPSRYSFWERLSRRSNFHALLSCIPGRPAPLIYANTVNMHWAVLDLLQGGILALWMCLRCVVVLSGRTCPCTPGSPGSKDQTLALRPPRLLTREPCDVPRTHHRPVSDAQPLFPSDARYCRIRYTCLT